MRAGGRPRAERPGRWATTPVSEIEQLEGGCLCGGVRYRVSGPWLRFVHCHCSRCRRATGTGHATNLFAAPGNLSWLVGASQVARFDLPEARSFATAFCRACGSPLPHLTRSGSAWVVPAGSLDEGPGLTPSARIFWSSRASWSCDESALPRFPEQIPD